MFKTLKKLVFGVIIKRHQTHYVAFCRGNPVIIGSSKKELEVEIRNMFDKTDAKMITTKGFGPSGKTSRHARMREFRSMFVIKELCKTCGFQKGYCVQC